MSVGTRMAVVAVLIVVLLELAVAVEAGLSGQSPQTIGPAISGGLRAEVNPMDSDPITAPSTPTVNGQSTSLSLEDNQALDVVSTLSGTGTAPVSWQWLVSENGGGYNTVQWDGVPCAVSSGSGAGVSDSETCSLAPDALYIGFTYTFELQVTDSENPPQTATSLPSPDVLVIPALTVPSTPTVNGQSTPLVLDDNGVLDVVSTLSGTGTAPVSWQWLVSENGGGYNTVQWDGVPCAVSSGSGAGVSDSETCSLAPDTLYIGYSYSFELQVTDTEYPAQTLTTSPSPLVSVVSDLAQPQTPTVNGQSTPLVLDDNEALDVVSPLSGTGTAPIAWQWLVSENGGGYNTVQWDGVPCAVPSGTGAGVSDSETCSLAPDTLYVGYSYSFELQVTDTEYPAQTLTTSPSPLVSVVSDLAQPQTPTVNGQSTPLILYNNQDLQVVSTLSGTGTAPISWQWLVSVNGGGYNTVQWDGVPCAVPSGQGAGVGATEICSLLPWALSPRSTYSFELEVMDSEYPAQTVVSEPSPSVAVVSAPRFSVTFTESGLSPAVLGKNGWTVVLNGTRIHSTSPTIDFLEASFTYGVLVTGPAKYTSTVSGTLTVAGVTPVLVPFSKAKTVTLKFGEKGLAKGRSWCVEVDTAEECTSATSQKYLNITPASYVWSVVSPLGGQNITQKIGSTTKYGPTGTITLSRSTTVALTFAYRYAVTFTENGFSGTTWTVTIKGATLSSPTGDPITFYLVNGTYAYKVEAETGYTIVGTPPKVTVNGSATSVIVTFTKKS